MNIERSPLTEAKGIGIEVVTTSEYHEYNSYEERRLTGSVHIWAVKRGSRIGEVSGECIILTEKDSERKWLYFHGLKVNENERRQGIGSAIVNTLEKIAIEKELDNLEAFVSKLDLKNKPFLREFYEKLGFIFELPPNGIAGSFLIVKKI